MVVPTLAIAEQLYHKHNEDEGIEFLFSGDNTQVMKEDKEGIFLTICTYDAYFYNTFEDHILYIDEAHEMVSFHSIGKKRKIIDGLLEKQPKNTVYITASPLNLADVFDKKVLYTKDTNKDTTIVQATSIASGALELIERHAGQKILVYINSMSKLTRFKQTINTHYPDLTVDIISSHNRGDSYDELLKNEDLNFDIVLVTKFLNIGFDINNVFDIVIYADQDVRANDVLQFFNRERQHAKFYCIVKKDMKHSGINVNTSYAWYHNKLPEYLTKNDRLMLDNTYTGDSNNPHLITNYYGYRFCNIGFTPLVKLFEYFYENFSYDDEDSIVKLITFPTVKVRHQFDTVFVHVLENGYTQFELLLTDFLLGNEIEWTLVPGGSVKLTSKAIGRLLTIFVTIRRNLLYFIRNPHIMDINDEGIKINYLEPDYWYYLVDDFLIMKFDNEEYIKILSEIQEHPTIDVLTEYEISGYCDSLNVRKLFINNRPWTPDNFIKNAQLYRIYFERYKDKDTKEYLWVNKTKKVN